MNRVSQQTNLTPPTEAGWPLPYIKEPPLPITGQDLLEAQPNPTNNERPVSTPYYKPFIESGRTDEFYKRYLKLAQNVAYKYPNYGPHVERQGCGGASWRHIKQVQGYENRVLYVDGRVRLYEKDDVPRLSYTPTLGRSTITPIRNTTPSHGVFLPTSDPEPWKQMKSPVKYKGFYCYKH